jgi:hypothetical protein
MTLPFEKGAEMIASLLGDTEFASGFQVGSESFSDSYDADELPTEFEIRRVVWEQTSPAWMRRMETVARLTDVDPLSLVYRSGLLAGWFQAYASAMMEASHAA